MAIYVDPLFATQPSQKWPYRQACHLTADTVEELHAFAKKLGLKRIWFQGHHRNPLFWHYDLTENKRRQAILLGAVSLTTQQWVERVQQSSHRPYQGKLPKEKGSR